MLTIDRVIELKDLIKWHTVFCEAGLNSNTMRSAIRNRRELRKEEAAAIVKTLAHRGICFRFDDQKRLFAEEGASGKLE